MVEFLAARRPPPAARRPPPAARRPPLPLPVLPSPRAGTMVYGLAAIDSSGRIADRTVIRALGWAPGTRLHIREGSGVIVVRLDRQGVFTVTGQGHLHLPSAPGWARSALAGEHA
ncbi:hypothetical protein [Micromonospora sp. IBHARD004]|uniref:hypothetical protein n=1 Tax=Micromonospora sp. IBHARD004 TaxID=3457764 RepID=UPI0040595413